MRIYGQLQYAKRKRRPVNAILHALLMIASRLKKNVKRNARFARPNMNYFTMLSSLSTSRNEMGIDITFLLCVQVYLCHHVKGPLISKCLFGVFNSPEKQTKTIPLERRYH